MSEVKVVQGEDGKVQAEISDKQEEKQEVHTEESLKESGLGDEEIKMAKEQGMIAPEKSEEDKTKEAEEAKNAKDMEEAAKKGEEGKAKEKPGKEKSMSDEEEHEHIEKMDKSERGQYFKMKDERRKRQTAESERDLLKIKLKAQEEQGKKALEAKKKAEPDLEEEFKDPLDDLNDDDIPTVAQIRESRRLRKEHDAKVAEKVKADADEVKADKTSAAQTLNDNLAIAEKTGSEKYDDFEKTVSLATNIFETNGADLDKSQLRQANMLRTAWIEESIKLSKGEGDPENAADIMYELGQLHADYNKQSDEGEKGEQKKELGGKKLSKSEIERAEKNAGKRLSSASLGSAANRVIDVEDLTLADIADMDQADYDKLPAATKERALKMEIT